MSQPTGRRFVTVLSLATALFHLPMVESQAAQLAQRRLRGDSDFLTRVEAQAQSFWRTIVSVWQNAGLRMDDNGGW